MSKKLPRHFTPEAQPLSGHDKLALLLSRHKRGGAAWFFDLDGTLIHVKPGENANIPADTDLQHMLNTLTRQSNGAVAVVTGRPRVFVEALIPSRNFASGVEHGAILQEVANGPWHRRSKLEKSALDKIRAVLEERIKGIAGAQVEDHKEGTLTVEFTAAANPDRLADELEAAIKAYLASQSGLAIDVLKATVPGNYVIELLPQGAGKAQAVDHLMASAPFAGKIPVFCGDSAGDAGAMQRVRELGGIAIGIGPKAPACRDVHFADVRAMRAFMSGVTSGPTPRQP
ncbi:MAG: trehalose-phosphatase [Alphaproteobacteria bacterium]|nr:trehalose-phosphatase [Alphaproteobacteria bacterium]